MSTKADYTEDEWKTIIEAPTSAGMIVITASRGGTFRETFSMAKAYTEARKQHGASALLDDVVSTNPKVDRHGGSPAELETRGLGHLRDAVALIGAKGSPEEVDEYRRFVVGLAERVAHAHREGGVEVSDTEQAAINQIEEALGGSGGDGRPRRAAKRPSGRSATRASSAWRYQPAPPQGAQRTSSHSRGWRGCGLPCRQPSPRQWGQTTSSYRIRTMPRR